MKNYILIISMVAFSAGAVELSLACEILKGNLEANFSNKFVEADVPWIVEAVQVCGVNKGGNGEHASYRVLSKIKKSDMGFCVYQSKKVFREGQSPTWSFDSKEDTKYGREIDSRCLDYSVLNHYMSLGSLPESLDKNKYFYELVQLFEKLNGSKKDIENILSSIPFFDRYFQQDYQKFSSLLLKNKGDNFYFPSFLYTVSSLNEPEVENIILNLKMKAYTFQVTVGLERKGLIINNISMKE